MENTRNTTTTRKIRAVMNNHIFDQIKRFYKTKTKAELMELTQLGKYALNDAIQRIENSLINDPTYADLYKKTGRKSISKTDLHSQITQKMASDTSLTQKGCNEAIELTVSKSGMCREFKAIGLKRKRIKKKPDVMLTPVHIATRLSWFAEVYVRRNRRFLFLDESGFNLHTNTNYGYAMVGRDATLYQPPKK